MHGALCARGQQNEKGGPKEPTVGRRARLSMQIQLRIMEDYGNTVHGSLRPCAVTSGCCEPAFACCTTRLTLAEWASPVALMYHIYDEGRVFAQSMRLNFVCARV